MQTTIGLYLANAPIVIPSVSHLNVRKILSLCDVLLVVKDKLVLDHMAHSSYE